MYFVALPAFAGEVLPQVDETQPIAVPVWVNRPLGPVNQTGIYVDVVVLQTVGEGSLTVCYTPIRRKQDDVSTSETVCNRNLTQGQTLNMRKGNTYRVLAISALEILDEGEYVVFVQVNKANGYAFRRTAFTSVFTGEDSVLRQQNTFPYHVAGIRLDQSGELQFLDRGCLLGPGSGCFGQTFSVKVLARVTQDNPFSAERFPADLLPLKSQRVSLDGGHLYSPERNFCPSSRIGRATRPVVVVEGVSQDLDGNIMDETVTVPGFCGSAGIGSPF